MLIGDFNIFKPQERTFKALERHGFVVPVIGQPTRARIGSSTKSLFTIRAANLNSR